MPTIATISESLSEFVSANHFVSETATIEQVCLPEKAAAGGHTLYFGHAEEFQPDQQYENILCIDHNQIISQYIRSGTCNVIVLSKRSPQQVVFNRVAALLRDHSRQLFGNLLALLNSDDINLIIRHIAEFFGCPALLLDSRHAVRSHWPSGAKARDGRYPFQKQLEKSGFSRMEGGTLFARVEIDRTPSLLVQLTRSEKLAGYLLLLGMVNCNEHHLEPIAAFLANKLTAADSVFRTETYSFETFIIDMLNGIRHNPAKIDEVLSLAGWDRTDSYYFIKIEPTAPDTPSQAVQQCNTALAQALPMRSAAYADAVYGIINRSKSGYFYREDFTKQFTGLMTRCRVRVGFSDIFTHFHYIYDCARQPDIAIQYGSLFNPAHLTHPYDFYAQYELINIMSTHMDMEQYVHPIVRLLNDHDSRYGSEYITTLYAYLNEDRKIQSAANFLGIHKNSMLKRLEKIRQITALDPNLLFRTTHMRLSCSIVKHLALMENGTVPSLPELPLSR